MTYDLGTAYDFLEYEKKYLVLFLCLDLQVSKLKRGLNCRLCLITELSNCHLRRFMVKC